MTIEWNKQVYTAKEMALWDLPMVEIFETIEGEGFQAGFPTVFVRLFHCNLRCSWCDTPYSYAPAKPEFQATIAEIADKVSTFSSQSICLTGGEPLMHHEKSAGLIHHLSLLPKIEDIHIETNGAIDLDPFATIRQKEESWASKVRFVMDFKLPDSGEMDKMLLGNFDHLDAGDELKFVIGSERDFEVALDVMNKHHHKGTVLMSPVWESMSPRQLVELVLKNGLSKVKVSLQLHKIIWDPAQRGV